MKDSNFLILIFVIVVFGVLIFVGANLQQGPGTTGSSEPSKKITISYSSSKRDSIVWEGEFGSYVEQPDTGKVFLEVDMTISNNGYESFSTNSFYFFIVADNVKHSVAFETYTLGAWDTVDVLDGGTFHGTLVFQIPESASSFTLVYDSFLSDYNIVWNEI